VVDEARMPSLSSFFPTLKPTKVLLNNEGRDSLVTFSRIEIGKNY
jgi:hypothetical protein